MSSAASSSPPAEATPREDPSRLTKEELSRSGAETVAAVGTLGMVGMVGTLGALRAERRAGRLLQTAILFPTLLQILLLTLTVMVVIAPL